MCSVHTLLLVLSCRMDDNTFNADCADRQIQASNLSVSAVQDCMGNSDSDADHPLLKVSAAT